MGYHTNYTLCIHGVYDTPGGVLNHNIDKELIDRIDSEIEKMNVFETYYDGQWSLEYSSWSWYEEDMATLSTVFPNVVFELHGEGEIQDDIWNAYFLNGSWQFCPAIITFDEYSEQGLNPVRVRDGYVYSYSPRRKP